MMRYVAFLLALCASAAWGQVEIDKPWIRATAPGAKVAAGYMTIVNTAAQPDRLVGGVSAVAAKVETHVHIRDGEILRMREVQGYDIPAKGRFELRPGGAHLMLVDIRQPLKEGDSVPVTLEFERAGEVTVNFRVGRLTAPSGHKH
jgi:periplasmic copper chaperone A